MYYKLSKQYSFRGWKHLPFAIQALSGAESFETPRFYSKDNFRLLIRCNGVEDIDIAGLAEAQVDLLDSLVKEGIIETSSEPMGALEREQRYLVYPSIYLRSIQWSITGRCNYSCRHCFVSAPTGCHSQLPLEALLGIVDQMKATGVRSVSITGGEPLVNKDFLEIVRKLTENNIIVTQIFTNGKLLTEALLDALTELGVHPLFQLSFDGKGHHSWLRGIDGAEEDVIAAIDLLRGKGFPYACAMCIHKENAESLAETVRFLAENECLYLGVNAPHELGIWNEYGEEYALSPPEIWEIYKSYLPVYFSEGAPITITLDGFIKCDKGSIDYSIPYDHRLKDPNYPLEKRAYCPTTRHAAYIDPEGRLLPCMGFAGSEKLNEKFSSVLEGNLPELTWNSFYSIAANTTVQELANHDAECRDCEHLGECTGGCMVGGLTEDGDYLKHDPMACWFYKNVGVEGLSAVADEAIASAKM